MAVAEKGLVKSIGEHDIAWGFLINDPVDPRSVFSLRLQPFARRQLLTAKASAVHPWAAFELLVFHPGIGEEVDNARLQGTRSLQIDRIRYDLYYVLRVEELIILSLWLSNRGQPPRM